MLPDLSATISGTAVRAPARADTLSESRWFYVRMGYACAAIAVVGFLPTYWLPLASGRFDGPPLLHFHGWLFTAWMVLFILQARAAATYRFERHRAMGLAGIAIATAIVLTGLAVAAHAIERGSTAGFRREALTFSIVPISIILTFAGAVAAAFANVRRTEHHIRWMVVATIVMLPPAFARLLFMALAAAGATRPPGAPPTTVMALLPSGASDLVLAVAIVHDWRLRGRPHPVYVVAALTLLAVQIGRIFASDTAAWHAVAGWLVRFAA